MRFNLDLSAVPDAALPALRTICADTQGRAPRLFDGLLAGVVAEGQRRNEGAAGCVELDLTGATIADVSEALDAALAVAAVTTGFAHRESSDVIAAGWVAVACVFLDIRAQILATADLDALRAFRAQTSPPPNAA